MTTATNTQLAAYYQIVNEGRINGLQRDVYHYLLLTSAGAVTRNELDAALGNGAPNAGYSRRLAEMERRGLVRRAAVRECRVTQRPCETWEAIPDASPSASTGRMKTADRPLSAAERLRAADGIEALAQEFLAASPAAPAAMLDAARFALDRVVPSLRRATGRKVPS
jgi:hypothetical protein